MKLLLTSAGLYNQSIVNALFELVGKKAEETSLAFVPTAANVEKGNKGWLIDDLINLKKQNFKSIDIVDISALDKNLWLPRLEEADVLFFEGGDTFYLMEWINKSGLAEILPELLKTKVYVGVSAGSMVTNKDLSLKISQDLYGEDLDKTKDVNALSFVDFCVLPHLGSKHFPRFTKENLEKASKEIPRKIYALDDQSALKIVDGDVEIVSEGECLVFN